MESKFSRHIYLCQHLKLTPSVLRMHRYVLIGINECSPVNINTRADINPLKTGIRQMHMAQKREYRCHKSKNICSLSAFLFFKCVLNHYRFLLKGYEIVAWNSNYATSVCKWVKATLLTSYGCGNMKYKRLQLLDWPGANVGRPRQCIATQNVKLRINISSYAMIILAEGICWLNATKVST